MTEEPKCTCRWSDHRADYMVWVDCPEACRLMTARHPGEGEALVQHTARAVDRLRAEERAKAVPDKENVFGTLQFQDYYGRVAGWNAFNRAWETLLPLCVDVEQIKRAAREEAKDELRPFWDEQLKIVLQALEDSRVENASLRAEQAATEPSAPRFGQRWKSATYGPGIVTLTRQNEDTDDEVWIRYDGPTVYRDTPKWHSKAAFLKYHTPILDRPSAPKTEPSAPTAVERSLHAEITRLTRLAEEQAATEPSAPSFDAWWDAEKDVVGDYPFGGFKGVAHKAWDARERYAFEPPIPPSAPVMDGGKRLRIPVVVRCILADGGGTIFCRTMDDVLKAVDDVESYSWAVTLEPSPEPSAPSAPRDEGNDADGVRLESGDQRHLYSGDHRRRAVGTGVVSGETRPLAPSDE